MDRRMARNLLVVLTDPGQAKFRKEVEKLLIEYKSYNLRKRRLKLNIVTKGE